MDWNEIFRFRPTSAITTILIFLYLVIYIVGHYLDNDFISIIGISASILSLLVSYTIASMIAWCFSEGQEKVKDFLRPDRKKLVLFLVIVLLANTPYIGTYKGERVPCAFPTWDMDPNIDTDAECDTGIDYFELNPVFWPKVINNFISLRSSSFKNMIPFLNLGCSIKLDYCRIDEPYKFTGVLLYWYFASCTIVWLYKKIRN